jgi:hypothetical protein
MICTAREAAKNKPYHVPAALAGAAQLLSPVSTRCCSTQPYIIIQIAHGEPGQYSSVSISGRNQKLLKGGENIPT